MNFQGIQTKRSAKNSGQNHWKLSPYIFFSAPPAVPAQVPPAQWGPEWCQDVWLCPSGRPGCHFSLFIFSQHQSWAPVCDRRTEDTGRASPTAVFNSDVAGIGPSHRTSHMKGTAHPSCPGACCRPTCNIPGTSLALANPPPIVQHSPSAHTPCCLLLPV